jgi:hypothetical protein
MRTPTEALITPRDALITSRDALPVPWDALPISRDAVVVPKDALRVRRDAARVRRDAPRVRRASPTRPGNALCTGRFVDGTPIPIPIPTPTPTPTPTSDLGLRTSDFGLRTSDLGPRISALRLRVRSPVREGTRAFAGSLPGFVLWWRPRPRQSRAGPFGVAAGDELLTSRDTPRANRDRWRLRGRRPLESLRLAPCRPGSAPA